MTVFERLDLFFASPHQRAGWLGLFGSMYLMWQIFWTVLVLGQLAFVQNYDQLFSLYAGLEAFRSSLLIRLFLALMSASTFKAAQMALMAAVHLPDLAFCLAMGLYASSQKQKAALFSLFGLLLGLGGLVFFCLVGGLRAGTMVMVLKYLHIFGILGILLEILIFLNVLVLSQRQIQAVFSGFSPYM